MELRVGIRTGAAAHAHSRLKQLSTNFVLLLGMLLAAQAHAAGIGPRQPNTTLQLGVQKPPSFPYMLEPAWKNIGFKDPVAIVAAPGESTRVFVVEQGGTITAINDINNVNPTASVFLNIADRINYGNPEGEGGTLGLAFHPSYAANGHFFVFYLCNATTDKNGRHNRLSRFTRSKTDPSKADPNSELILFTQSDEEFNHNGGSLLFGPDGYLYVTLGDEGYPDDIFNNGQRIDKDFFGGVIRIDVDKKAGNLPPTPHPALDGKVNYYIPSDNPWVGATTFNGQPIDTSKLRAEFYAVGLRSPWRMHLDGPSGNIYVSDVGEIGRLNNRSEEINLIVKGGNYGWPYYESESPGPKADQAPAGFSSIGPLITYDRGNSGPYVGRAAIGGVVSRGGRLPEFNGSYIFGDYFTGNIWTLRHSGQSVQQWEFITSEGQGHIVSFASDPSNGDILVCDIIDDTVKRLVRVPAGDLPPATLADTGAFANLSALEPHAGIVPYDINVPFWSDGALKRRWFSIPNVDAKMTPNSKKGWQFPPGSVFIKHFDLEAVKGNPGTAQPVETRFLVVDETGVWGLTYEWQGNNAYLVPGEGKTRTFTVNDNGAVRQQTWVYPSRTDCNSCHTPVAGHVLGFNTRQLDKTYEYPGGAENQLRALAAAGYLNGSPGGGKPMAPLSDTRASLDTRVRSYLDVNCSQCHQPGGPARANWDARFTSGGKGVVNARLVDTLGNPENRVVKPGDPAHSIALTRMESLDQYARMPPLASTVVDQEAVAVFTQWINSIKKGKTRAVPLSVKITAPKGSKASEAVTISGTARGEALTGIVYTVNGGAEQTASGTTEWSADLALQPGVNRVLVYAIDGQGGKSRAAKKTLKVPAAQ